MPEKRLKNNSLFVADSTFACFDRKVTLKFLIIMTVTASLAIGCAGVSYLKSSDGLRALKIKGVKQSEKYSCGSASVATIRGYWGDSSDETEILKKHPPASKQKGYSLKELQKILKSYGFSAFVIKGSRYTLNYEIMNGRPVIVAVKITPVISKVLKILTRKNLKWHREYSHFLTVYGLDSNFFYIFDPQKGYMKMKINDFREIWASKGQYALLSYKGG